MQCLFMHLPSILCYLRICSRSCVIYASAIHNLTILTFYSYLVPIATPLVANWSFYTLCESVSPPHSHFLKPMPTANNTNCPSHTLLGVSLTLTVAYSAPMSMCSGVASGAFTSSACASAAADVDADFEMFLFRTRCTSANFDESSGCSREIVCSVSYLLLFK